MTATDPTTDPTMDPTTATDHSTVPVIGILVGSTRPTRVGRQLADQIAELARLRSEADITVVDLAEVALPFLDEPEMPSLGRYVHEHTRAWKRTIDGLDALIIVSPQYNGGYPAPLKNAIDFLYAEWSGKPILLVTYGYHGGVLAAEQLVPVLTRIKANVLEPQIAMTVTDADRKDRGQLADPCQIVERHRAPLEVGFAAIHAALGC